MSKEDTQRGKKLLAAVESIIVHPNALIRLVEQHSRAVPVDGDQQEYFREVGRRIITHYSRRTALAGSLAATPALLPGGGTLVAMLGGNLADMVFTLKFEVEMALCLTHLYGYDITDPHQRQLAFLLASVSTYEASSPRHILSDFALAQGEAIWNYTPRQVSKFLVSILAKLALVTVTKSAVKAIPLVGIAVAGGMNKVLTTKVGQRCLDELSRRRNLEGEQPIIEAQFERDMPSKTGRRPRKGASKP